jgi:hypothetical protein
MDETEEQGSDVKNDRCVRGKKYLAYRRRRISRVR